MSTNNVNAENNTSKRMTNKQRRIMNSVFIVIFLLIFAGVNVLAMFLVDKFPNLELDVTSKGAYTLRDTTKEYLNYLERDISVKVLMEEQQLLAVDSDYGYQVNKLLREMSTYKRINLEYLDITAVSVQSMTQKYPDVDWTATDNLIIVEDAETGKYECLHLYDVFSPTYDASYNIIINGQYTEQSVLSGIQKVTAERVIKIALTTGNGEFFNENSDLKNYCSYLPVTLDDNAYEVEYLNLLTEAPSADTDIILMMAPSADLTSEAVDALSKWIVNDGNYGKTFFYVPYDRATEMTNLNLFLEQWGMAVTKGYINETDLSKGLSMMGEASKLFPMVNYVDDEFSQGLTDRSLAVLMPYCMPVEILDSNLAAPLLTSTTEAQLLVPAEITGDEPQYVESDGTALNAAAIATKANDDEVSSNVIVWGSYDGLSNDWLYSAYSSNFNNASYFINLLNTLTDNDASIVVESVDIYGESLVVTSAQQVIVFIFFVAIIPITIIVIGIVVWVKRRNR